MNHSILPTLIFLVSLGATTFAQAQTDANSQNETQPKTESQMQETSQKMFDFTAQNTDQWQIVNDGVMGGRSTSKATMIDGDKMQFSGTLSLENNGGFASVRSVAQSLDLKQDDAIMLRVKGDGRKYTFNLYIPTQQVAFSYQKDFETKKDEWTEIELPLSGFQAKSFGETVDQPLVASKVNSVGVLLGDKKEGAFDIVIDWIKVAPSK